MTQEQFEQKKKELKKQFKNEKRKAFFIWLVFNVVFIAVVWFVTAKFFPTRYPLSIAIAFSGMFISTWIWAKESVQLGKCEKEQWLLFQEEQPMRRFKYDD